MLASASHVVGKADARAEVLVVVLRNLADVGIRDWAVVRHQCQIGTAVLDVRPSDHVEILVPSQAKI